MKSRLAVVLGVVFCLALSAGARAAGPDLTTSPGDFQITPDLPTPESSVGLTVTVHNLGSGASKATSVSAKVLLGNKKKFSGKVSLPSIPAGGSAPVTFTLGSFAVATYTLSVKVDPSNAVAETNENNNKASITLAVAAASGDAGEAAAAVYGTTQKTVNTLLRVADVALAGIRSQASEDEQAGEAAHACTRSGALDYAVERTGLRVTRVTVTSPAPGASECEGWLAKDSTDPETGYYERFADSIQLDVRYLSDAPTDPGFLKIASMTLTAGDGNPATPEALAVGTYEAYRDGAGSLQTRLIIAESCDLVMNISVLGWDALGFPNHLLYTADGLLSHYDAEQAGSIAVTLSGFTMDGSYTGVAGDLGIALTLGGTIRAANSLSSTGNFSVTFRGAVMNLHLTPTVEQVAVNGGFDLVSSCTTGSFQFSTIEPVLYVPGALCPQAGKVAVTSPVGDATILFNVDQSMSIDENSDGSIDRTYLICWEASFSLCG